ncbi:MAG: GDYXXLXY domain-containing protein [Roseibium sp.]|uniref:GDYXXLXY domain-containing protein n=1 Tax=Roseibium sp. TaxID=1936156 RepID=UPI00263971CF|nr:GDYXXLXY domain-containing protein [Roseibium sp.]MCV0426942.1 GDYXXLXY domain-containing protein [Roseibium sp.]
MSLSADTLPPTSDIKASRSYLRWGLLALIQLALIAIPLADRLQVQMSGTVVPMELVPVDPRDLLRGDYVIINLAIARISTDVPGTDSAEIGERIFVGLRSEGKGPAKPVVVARDRKDAGRLAIEGTVNRITGDFVQVDYGIDAFFLPEGEGRFIEDLDTSRVMLEVAIDEEGQSLPLTLLVDGKVFKSDGTF